MANTAFLRLNAALYSAVRPLIFRSSAQQSHARIIALLRWLDRQEWAQATLRLAQRWAFDTQPTTVGGVALPYPLILAAGFVKGEGFADEAAALAAVERDCNIIPGWRSMPALVGPVEFGSFTPWPRLGNPGIVMWRDMKTRSTQNRVGLKNPGAKAAAAFLAKHSDHLPAIYGINIAPSPGLNDPAQELDELLRAFEHFLAADIRPAWFTLNLSCPNTEDDPGGRQTEAQARRLCRALVDLLPVPLWVKISPDLAEEQYTILMGVFAEVGVQAVIATNTLARSVPDQPEVLAGVGGAGLHNCAVAATIRLSAAAQAHSPAIIACGGIMDGPSLRDFQAAQAAQYWSAMIYRGPLAAALILNEERHAR